MTTTPEAVPLNVWCEHGSNMNCDTCNKKRDLSETDSDSDDHLTKKSKRSADSTTPQIVPTPSTSSTSVAAISLTPQQDDTFASHASHQTSEVQSVGTVTIDDSDDNNSVIIIETTDDTLDVISITSSFGHSPVVSPHHSVSYASDANNADHLSNHSSPLITPYNSDESYMSSYIPTDYASDDNSWDNDTY